MRFVTTLLCLGLFGTCGSPTKHDPAKTIGPVQAVQANSDQTSTKLTLEKITEVTPILGSISFGGPNEVGLIGASDQKFWLTTDHGKTWAESRVPYGAKGERSGWFDLVKSVITRSGIIHVVGHLEEAGTAVFTSTDYGKTWRHTIYESSTLNDIAAFENDSWLAGTIHGSGVVLKSTNKQEWQIVSKGMGQYLTGINFADSNSGWVVGADGLILHTTDGGHTWKRQVSAIQAMLNSVSFANGSTGFVVGDKGTILHTNDGGFTWSRSESNTQTELTRVVMKNSDEACVVGRNGTLLVTNNSGKTWSSYSLGTKADVYALALKDNDYWIATSDGAIFRLGTP